MLIAVASPFRTGSTRLFNVLRIILEQNYKPDDLNYLWISNLDKEKINVTKLHDDLNWKNFDIDYIFTTKRDIRYIMSSCLEYFSIIDKKSEKNLEWFDTICKQVIKQYNDWKYKSNLEIVYEKWESEKIEYICKIAEILNLFVDPCEVLKRFENLLNETEYKGDYPKDKRYLGAKFHRSKNTNLSWKNRLPQEFASHLESNYSEYFYAE